jgi:hypothetical protein
MERSWPFLLGSGMSARAFTNPARDSQGGPAGVGFSSRRPRGGRGPSWTHLVPPRDGGIPLLEPIGARGPSRLFGVHEEDVCLTNPARDSQGVHRGPAWPPLEEPEFRFWSRSLRGEGPAGSFWGPTSACLASHSTELALRLSILHNSCSPTQLLDRSECEPVVTVCSGGGRRCPIAHSRAGSC